MIVSSVAPPGTVCSGYEPHPSEVVLCDLQETIEKTDASGKLLPEMVRVSTSGMLARMHRDGTNIQSVLVKSVCSVVKRRR